jgi:hypothetical protein
MTDLSPLANEIQLKPYRQELVFTLALHLKCNATFCSLLPGGHVTQQHPSCLNFSPSWIAAKDISRLDSLLRIPYE